MFEHRTQPLLPRRHFVLRLVRGAGVATGIIGASLGLGTVGYHLTEGLGWVDSLLNAAMILTGMGPANPLQKTSAKLFATGYALFSAFIFLTATAIIMGPIFHRFFHRFHLDASDNTSVPQGSDHEETG